MNTSTQTFSPFLRETTQPNFIHLKNITFAEYNFIYHINDGYNVKELTKFNDKNQLLFQKISNKVMQMNLMMVDTVFPLLIADVVMAVFLEKFVTFQEYADAKKKIFLCDKEYDSELLEYKFRQFIHYLLFSDIFSKKVFKGTINSDNVYYLKDENGELKYYTFYEQNELQEIMFHKMKLEIDLKKSFLRKEEVEISLKISI